MTDSTVEKRRLHRMLTSTELGSGGVVPQLPEHEMDPAAAAKFDKAIKGAVQVVNRFFNPKLLKDQSIPKELLSDAHGLLFLTVYKAGFLLSGKIGTGFVIARTSNNSWSAPSFVGTAGLAFGMMAGGERVDYMIILSSRRAVNAFTRDGQVQLGSELDIAVGPLGRAAAANVNIGTAGLSPNYTYSHCIGLYGGIGLSGAGVITRKSLNSRYYGPYSSQRNILSGAVQSSRAQPLSDALEIALRSARGELRTAASNDDLDVYTITPHSGSLKTGDLILAEGMAPVAKAT